MLRPSRLLLPLAAMALAACHDPEGIAEDALAVRDLVDIALVAEATEGHFTFTGRQGDDDCSGSVAVGPYDDEATAQIEIVCLPPPGAHTAALVANASPATVAQARRCDGGISTACTSLGLRYAKGDGIPKDLGKANMLYTQACASGDAGGCYQQAKAMDSAGAEQGSAVVALLVTACDLGDAAACGDAAQRLYNADEHDQVPTMARMARKGCDGDDRQACLVLGVLYAYGVGVPLDMDQARKRLMQACSGGLEPACDLVENL